MYVLDEVRLVEIQYPEFNSAVGDKPNPVPRASTSCANPKAKSRRITDQHLADFIASSEDPAA